MKTIATSLGLTLTFLISMPTLASTANNKSDATITDNIKTQLLANPSTANITVQTTNGVVTLAGNVASTSQAKVAIAASESLPEVKAVNAQQLQVQSTLKEYQVATNPSPNFNQLH